MPSRQAWRSVKVVEWNLSLHHRVGITVSNKMLVLPDYIEHHIRQTADNWQPNCVYKVLQAEQHSHSSWQRK